MNHLNKSDRILELGCGTGHLAKLLIYDNYKYIRGVDTDKRIINIVRRSFASRHRELFIEALFNSQEALDCDYDTVICQEVFEYADCDLAVLKKLKSDVKVIFTVAGHHNEAYCRWFSGEKAIRTRYEGLIEIEGVEEIIFNHDYCKRYVVKARTK